MAEYIEREVAKDVMALIVLEAIAHPDTYTCGEAKRAIESIPPADVQPVMHGKWIDGEIDGIVGGFEYRFQDCSNCGYSHSFPLHYKYCPNCGARMDGGHDG